MRERYIGIKFPFEFSSEGNFLDLTTTTKDAVRSSLSHLIMTKRGERLYRPDFGLGLENFLFEPLDETTRSDIREQLIITVKTQIPQITIENVEFQEDQSQLFVGIKVTYSFNEGILSDREILEIQF